MPENELKVLRDINQNLQSIAENLAYLIEAINDLKAKIEVLTEELPPQKKA